MSDFIDVASTDGFEDGEMLQATVDGHELLVARIGDEFLIADARCPHLRGHLAKGILEGTVVTCPLHHSQFDLADGHCVRWTDWSGPVKTMGELARHPRPLRVYESDVKDGMVRVGPEKPPVFATPSG
jgi:3-phenylpropionate/trans-cinnamate dioxygenase ferredoxin component